LLICSTPFPAAGKAVTKLLCGRRRGVSRSARYPDSWRETYATSDIVEYDGEQKVKVGREFLIKGKQAADCDSDQRGGVR
jgi:nicotinate phosphoribosyltransferase